MIDPLGYEGRQDGRPGHARSPASAEMAAILEFGRNNPRPDHEDIAHRRADVEATLIGPVAHGASVDEITVGTRSAIRISPDQKNPADGPTVLYLHGGAFEVGSARSYQAFCSLLAQLLDATVIVPEYRLAPEHPFPAAIDDVVAAYRGLLDMGHAAPALALVGDSAGGGLVLSCLIAARRVGLPQPAAAVTLSAWTDLSLQTESHGRCAGSDPFITTPMLRRAAQNYLAGADPGDPLASPVAATSEDLAGLAPVLMYAAANEVLADDSAGMAERMSAAGGDVTLELCPEAFHVWHMAGSGVPESEAALQSMARFLRLRWPP